MKNMQYGRLIWAGLITATIMVACKKEEYNPDFNLTRNFTPTGFQITEAETSVTVEWAPSLFSQGKAISYTIEVSKTPDFSGTIDYTKTVDTTAVVITDAELAVRQDYYARVKADANGTTAASGWVISESFSMTGEQLFLSIVDDYLTATSVQLRWKPSPDLTKIVLTPAAGSAIEHTLTPGELSASQAVISGLTPLTDYTAEIYKGTASKGILTFSTKSPRPTGANVITITPTDNLAALMATAAPNTIFVVEQGSLHTADAAIVLPANASITVWGDYGPNRAVLAFNGITLPATAGTIRFENVDFTGYQNNNPAGTKRQYIFNQSAANTTQSIEFENCIIRNLVNTPFRLQGSNGQTINNLVFNKCIAYDIGDNGSNGTYAFIHTNVATGKINNIKITNSTLYKIGYCVILHNAAPSQSVLIENSTFDNTTGDGRYFIDYNAQGINGSFQISNVIIGKTLSPAGSAKGVRAATTATTSNNFQVSNTVFTGNAIPGVTTYGGSNTDLFTDPAAGNFLIKDAGFSGKSTAGDPRWRL